MFAKVGISCEERIECKKICQNLINLFLFITGTYYCFLRTPDVHMTHRMSHERPMSVELRWCVYLTDSFWNTFSK